MIKVSQLCKSYRDGERKVQVLNDLSLEVPAGRSLAITGPSGSGKSTFLNLLAGLLVPDSGKIEVKVDNRVTALEQASEKERTWFRRQRIGYVHQFFNLVPTLTVWENVALPGALNKQTNLRERAMAILSAFELDDRANAFPDVLSGGEQQRVAVARAILIEPAIVLADEPTGNLDRENTEIVTRLLFGTCHQFATTLVVATHSMAVAQMADQHIDLGDSTGRA